jgi:predicted nuclease of restriction endonuclease-like RecB superfamily
MLPSRLLDYERTDDGRTVPRWLMPRDEPWLRELALEARAAHDRPLGEVTERLVDTVANVARRHGATRRAVEAVWTIERRRWTVRTDSPVPPRTIRRVVFELAAERPRDEALATAAAELGIAADRIEDLLFADRAHAKLLVAPTTPAVTTELAEAYNLALVQSLIARATRLEATVRSNLRRVVGYAKLLGLMATFDEAPDGATRMTLSGPLAIFHDTIKYGNALARWFPTLVATAGWALSANIILGGETSRFELDARSPLPRTHALPRAHDSRLEAQLEIDLRRLASEWRIEREVAVVRIPSPHGAPSKLAFPDFALVSSRGRVLVEVVGYWTPDYLAAKRAMMKASGKPLVMCIDERHADAELRDAPNVVAFKKRIDPQALVRACESALEPHGLSTAPAGADLPGVRCGHSEG